MGVYVYEDTLSFINHNRPLPPVTIEDMNTQEEFRDREYLNPELKEMFHALGLIESYGSGIRRAKHAMAENGNPPLLFEPLNDTDDYTMVTCPINEEYAYIRDHEDVATKGNNRTTSKTTSRVPDTGSTRERIVTLLSEEPNLSAASLAELIGITENGVRYQIKALRKEGRIRHEGSRKDGHWVIIDGEDTDG